MAQAKKKQATKTKKITAAKTAQSRKTSSKQARRTECSSRERNHVYIVTVMSMVAALLLCANAAMMIA